MSSASSSAAAAAAAAGSSAQHIDVDIEDDVRAGSTVEGADDEMTGDITSAAPGAQTPQDDSDLATSFYHNDSTKMHTTGSKPTEDTEATLIDDKDQDDLMESEVQDREERVSASELRLVMDCLLMAWTDSLDSTCIVLMFSNSFSIRRFARAIFKVRTQRQNCS